MTNKFAILFTFLSLPPVVTLMQGLHPSNQLQLSLFEIMLVLLSNSCYECLSFILSHLRLKGGCSPTGDGGQVDVTGIWYNNVFTLLLPL